MSKQLRNFTIQESTRKTGVPGLDAKLAFYAQLDGVAVLGPYDSRGEAFDRAVDAEETPGEIAKLRVGLSR